LEQFLATSYISQDAFGKERTKNSFNFYLFLEKFYSTLGRNLNLLLSLKGRVPK
jgi:hypothetical protein